VVDSVDDCTFTGCTVTGNGIGYEIRTGTTNTLIVGGACTGNTTNVSDSGTNTLITGASCTVGIARIGRSTEQHWQLSGDASYNDMTGVSAGKVNRIVSDAASTELRLVTMTASDISMYVNNVNTLRVTTAAIRPTTDLGLTLGSTSGRWSIGHMGNAQLSTVAATAPAGTVNIGGTVSSTVGAAGAASALPVNPLGYLIANVAGTQVKIPYYNS